MDRYDLVVIGSGPGGYRAAVLGALRGLSVAIVEKGVWGGCCLNRGCVPKKAWHHTARLVAASREGARRGLAGTLRADLAQAWEHQRRVSATVRENYASYLKRLGVAAIEGEARLAAGRSVEVGGRRLTAGGIVIATGSHPRVPVNLQRVPGRILTTDDLFEQPPPPGRRVAVVGSGVVATELAFILAMLGLEVAWLCQGEPLAQRGFSDSALRVMQTALDRHGVRARSGSRPLGATVTADGVELALPGGACETVDWVLLGTGRVPHTEGLDPEGAGVQLTPGGFVAVDEFQRTSAQGVHAIGDVCNSAMTANHALAEAAVAVADLVAPGSRKRAPHAVADVIYSAQELARIGLTEDEAEHAGFEPAVGFAAFEANPRALGQDDGGGFVRLLADMDEGTLLGAEIVGAEAGELINLVGQAFGHEDALARLAGFAYNHPARAEEVQNACETLAFRWGLGAAVFADTGA